MNNLINFEDPEIGVHIKNVEGVWWHCHLSQYCKNKNKTFYAGYLIYIYQYIIQYIFEMMLNIKHRSLTTVF